MKRNSFVAALGVAVAATLSVGFVNITPKVIYGEDNRADVYQIPSAQVREIADSTVALIPTRSLTKKAEGLIHIETSIYGKEMNLCKSEPYYDQPTAANCSGSLVGDDLIATAGHCISSSECSYGTYAFVFGFRMIDERTAVTTVSSEDVYMCKEIVAREYSRDQDYALVRLDRPVRGHRVLSMQTTSVQPGDDIYVVGHPSGLPTKVADGAKVRRWYGNAYFDANLDTYGGNSGSAVFNARTHEIVGILVRGAQDFIYDRENKCAKSNQCEDGSCRGEDVTNISYIVEALNRL